MWILSRIGLGGARDYLLSTLSVRLKASAWAAAYEIIGRIESCPSTNSEESNMELNRGDYVKLTNAEAEEVGVVWELNPKNAASVEVYWWNGGQRWARYYDPQSLSLVPPTEIPDYAIKLRDSLGF